LASLNDCEPVIAFSSKVGFGFYKTTWFSFLASSTGFELIVVCEKAHSLYIALLAIVVLDLVYGI
jgi:hypothetical protein